MKSRKIIGITGSIATGKSTAAQMIRDLGYKVIDSDKVGHRLMKKGEINYTNVVGFFGTQILDKSGEIDRQKLSSIVFGHEDSLSKLNELTHPNIFMALKDEIEASNDSIVFVELPLLFELKNENKLDLDIDEYWLVYVDQQTQISRLMDRNGYSYEEAQKRINSQMSIEDKKVLSDFIIRNDDDLNNMREQILFKLEDMKEDEKALHDSEKDDADSFLTGEKENLEIEDLSILDEIEEDLHLEEIEEKPKKKKSFGLFKGILKVIAFLFVVAIIASAMIYATVYFSLGREYEPYLGFVEKYSAENKLDEALVLSIIKVESNFNPKAKSGKGAVGLMQLMPETAQEIANRLKLNKKISEDDLYDPETNIMLGTRYYKYLVNVFKSESLAILAYNGGMGNVSKWLGEGTINEDESSYSNIPYNEPKTYLNRVEDNKELINIMLDPIMKQSGVAQWKRAGQFILIMINYYIN